MSVNKTARNMLFGGSMLAIFAIVASAMVAMTFSNTKDRIAQNERELLLKSLYALVPKSQTDNDILQDTIEFHAPELSGKQRPFITVYRARKNSQPVALIMNVTAPNGYGGPIRLLVAIRHDGTLAGVRVVSHRETPGLGDKIDIERSDWIHIFENRSLSSPSRKHWKVKKDGGEFDQLTGATITPRAIVDAVKKSLITFSQHKNELFAISKPIDESIIE
jgi:electron transport complex protein RnfG